MAILINQGKHVLMENKYTPIEKKNVLCQITKVAIHERFEKSLEITFRIVRDEEYKERTVRDTVTYDSESPMAWKYQSLRSAIKEPYQADEPSTIDIEKILLDKVLLIDFSKRVDKEGNEWQNCRYKKLPDNYGDGDGNEPITKLEMLKPLEITGTLPWERTEEPEEFKEAPWTEDEDNGKVPY